MATDSQWLPKDVLSQLFSYSASGDTVVHDVTVLQVDRNWISFATDDDDDSLQRRELRDGAVLQSAPLLRARKHKYLRTWPRSIIILKKCAGRIVLGESAIQRFVSSRRFLWAVVAMDSVDTLSHLWVRLMLHFLNENRTPAFQSNKVD